MKQCVAFHCCPAACAAGFAQGFIEPSEQVGQQGSARTDRTLPVLAIDALPIDTATAWHEAGHAVIGEIEGFRVAQIQIDHPYVTRFEPRNDPVTVRQALRHTLAGPIAERWRSRHVYRASDDELMFYVRAIRAKSGGRCDLCHAFSYIVEVRPDADDAAVLRHFRDVEAETIDLVTSQPVTAAIRALVMQLMVMPTMNGDDVRAVIQKFF